MKQFSKTIYQLIFLCACMVISTHVDAQRTSLRATVEPSEIMIGQQAAINLQVITPKDTKIQFPVFQNQQIVPGVEVLTMLPPDTTIENNVMTLNMKYIITSFDSTLYFIDSIPVSDGIDTIYSNSLGLKVIAPELKDSTKHYLDKLYAGETDTLDFQQMQLNDIKSIQKLPFSLQDLLRFLWIPLIILLLLLIIGLIIFFALRKKKKGYFFTPPPVIPPHQRALEALNKLKKEKIWQQGRNKEFYTSVTDILRRYILDRYRVNAPEMTSGEILDAIRMKDEADSVLENLKQILTTADLVKFAKYKPFPDENDLTMMNAFLFVNQTREPDPLPDKDSENQSDEENEEEKTND